MVLESFLGDCLIKNDGTHIKTGDLSSEQGGIIGLYFSAHWCPPCRGFTPKLSAVYKEIKSSGNNFEIVFISWDRDEDAFKSYHGEMPWLAIPFASAKEKDGCTEKFKVQGIPSLVLLDAATGDIVKSNGREAVDSYGAAGFPFTDARLEECKKEKEQARNKALKELSTLSFLAPLTKVEDQEKDVDLQKATSSCEAVAFAFMKGAHCRGSSLVLPKLVEIQEKLGESKLKVILVPMEDLSEFSEELKTKIKNTTMVKFGERSKDTVKRFETILSEIESPHVLVIATENDSSLKIVAENAARDIYYVGAAGFPWSEKALDDLKAKEEAQVKEWKTKQGNLEFFSPTEECHILDKSGEKVSLATLQSKEVVGIYFSAHWCGPCRAFTPKLVEVYKQCKEQGKNFEVVFLSSDRSKAAFDEYYEEMPWYALSYDDRDLKEILSKVFNVRGIPNLVLLSGAGEVITEDGRSAVAYGADYFPWNKEKMEKGEEEEEKRAKELLEKAKEAETKVTQEQKDAKKVVIQRHKGSPSDIKISASHHIEYGSFATVSAPSAVVPPGKKAFYEVTFKEGSGISQIGWATSKFEMSDHHESDGVGDCEHSYGFDGQRTCKWHDGNSNWGKKFEPNGDRVLGVAADLESGKLLFGIDGDWSEPMGVAFSDIDKDIRPFPALTASDMKIFVNFGYCDFSHGPPDPSYEKLVDVIET